MTNEPISAAEAARILGVSSVALLHHRKRGSGPAWTDHRKPGAKNAKPVYDRASVEAYGDHRKRHQDGRSYVLRLEILEKRIAELEANAPVAQAEQINATLANVYREMAERLRAEGRDNE